MDAYRKLLEKNKEWASSQINEDPEYFTRLTELQTPEILWIGAGYLPIE